MPSSAAALDHGDVNRGRDVPALLRLFLGELRRREDLAGELSRGAHVDDVLGADGGEDLVAEGPEPAGSSELFNKRRKKSATTPACMRRTGSPTPSTAYSGSTPLS